MIFMSEDQTLKVIWLLWSALNKNANLLPADINNPSQPSELSGQANEAVAFLPFLAVNLRYSRIVGGPWLIASLIDQRLMPPSLMSALRSNWKSLVRIQVKDTSVRHACSAAVCIIMMLLGSSSPFILGPSFWRGEYSNNHHGPYKDYMRLEAWVWFMYKH
jgi:hypothetical protein